MFARVCHKGLPKRTFQDWWHEIFIGRRPLLSPNQKEEKGSGEVTVAEGWRKDEGWGKHGIRNTGVRT